MQSHGNPECFAMSVISEMLPFERGAMMNLFFSRVSPADGVRPWPQPMPRTIERVGFGLRESLDAEVDEDPVEGHPMQAIELGPGQLTRSDAVHARAVPGAPGVGELRPVHGQSLLPCQLLHFLRHGCSPVDDGAEGIENERLDRCHLEFDRPPL